MCGCRLESFEFQPLLFLFNFNSIWRFIMSSAKSNSVHFASYGSDASNKPFADALLGFQPEATADVSLEKSDGPEQTSISAKKKQPRVPFKREAPVALTGNNEPSARVVAVEKNNLPDTRPHLDANIEPPQGNVSIDRLFSNYDALLLFINELHKKGKKSICTFFKQKKYGNNVVRSFLVLRVVPRPGQRIALCVIPGGTDWLARQFRVGKEFFLDEVLGQQEAPEERIVATLALRVIMQEVHVARCNAKNRKGG